MQLIEVTNKALEKSFIHFPIPLYKNEKNYIRPLDKDIKAVFDPTKNKNFRNDNFWGGFITIIRVSNRRMY